MRFLLFRIDFYLQEELFGFGFLQFGQVYVRNFFSIYWADGELLIDLFWFRICETYPSLWFK